MAVAKRHGFEDMGHAGMSQTISGNESFEREFTKVYDACMAKNRYCIYQVEQPTKERETNYKKEVIAEFATAEDISATSGKGPEVQFYRRPCTLSDYFPPGMSCKAGHAPQGEKGRNPGTLCESRDKTVMVFEDTSLQSQEAQEAFGFSSVPPPTCTIRAFHKANPPCVVDSVPKEPICNRKARIAVAKRHGFEDMARANMSGVIAGSERLMRAFYKVYEPCMAKNHYCIYRDYHGAIRRN